MASGVMATRKSSMVLGNLRGTLSVENIRAASFAPESVSQRGMRTEHPVSIKRDRPGSSIAGVCWGEQKMVQFYARKSILYVVTGLGLLLSACTGSTIHTASDLGPYNTLSIDAKQRLVISGIRPSTPGEPAHRVICAEPSPDALVAQAAVLSAQGNYSPSSGTPAVAGGVNAGLQESAASIALRTQSIQILRDGYYRLCETYLNGAIDKDTYTEVIMNLDTFINVALAIDGLSNAKSASSVAIGTGAITVNGAGTSGEDATKAGPLQIGAIADPKIVDAGKGGVDKDATPTAIAQIVRDFLNYKEDYHCTMIRGRSCGKLPSTNLKIVGSTSK